MMTIGIGIKFFKTRRRPGLYPEVEALTRAKPWSHEGEALVF